MSMRKLKVGSGRWVLVGLLLAGACTKTVEGENKAWTRNVARVGEMSATYPAFATALAEQKKRAEDAMAAARAISDKEQSAKKMSEANDLLESSSFVYVLSQLDGKQKTLRQKLISATTEAEHASDQAGARAAVEDAQRILRNFDEAIKTGAPTADAAQVVVRKIDGDLSSATTNVDKVVSAAKARKDAAAKAAPGTTGTAAAPGTPAAVPGAPVPKPQWKCEYCKGMNDDSRTTCSHCGAAKPAAGAAKPAPAGVKPATNNTKPVKK